MLIIAICCPNSIWILENNEINTILPSDVKTRFPEEHLSEFLLEGELIACILCKNIAKEDSLTVEIDFKKLGKKKWKYSVCGTLVEYV